MLDFQATDAVGMRVQSPAKIDSLPHVGLFEDGKRYFKRINIAYDRRVSIISSLATVRTDVKKKKERIKIDFFQLK